MPHRGPSLQTATMYGRPILLPQGPLGMRGTDEGCDERGLSEQTTKV
jgi:hypothetical protein